MNDTFVVTLVFAVRDGFIILLAGWIIYQLVCELLGAKIPPVSPVPVTPGVPPISPPPVGPVVPQPPSVIKPRFTGITATSFAGGTDSATDRTSAYDEKIIINGDQEVAASLPAHGQFNRLVRLFYNGKTVDAPTRDVGPWNGDPVATDDPYWDTGTRPQAETGHDKTGRKTNLAGIDITPAAWKALGYVGDPRNAKEKIDWDFVDFLEGKAPPPVTGPVAPGIPAHLVLMRKLRDMGIEATHDNAIILSWPISIANKFPEMADYAKSYIHDSTPWCGLTVAYVLAMSGLRPQFGPTDTDRFLWADSWRQFGAAVETPQPGDVLVFQWAGGGHHVTLYDHETTGTSYYCTGGNQGAGHVLSTEAMPMANCIAIRRPA